MRNRRQLVCVAERWSLFFVVVGGDFFFFFFAVGRGLFL